MAPRPYFPNLDGLRTVACLAVFLIHSFINLPSPEVQSTAAYRYGLNAFSVGHVGVNFFFVLSGFLITYLLLDEEKNWGRYNIPAFYRRRIVRIWPLYYACVAFGFLVMPVLKAKMGQEWNELANPWWYVTFLANVAVFFDGSEAAAFNLNVLWSVAIEEQFYLFWPLLLLLFRRARPVLFILLIVFSLAFRYLYRFDGDRLYQHTFSVLSDLVMGGGAAWLAFYRPNFRAWVSNWSRLAIVAGYVVGISLILAQEHVLVGPVLLTGRRVVLGLFFVFVILEQNYATESFYKMSHNRFLTYWGTFTYGFYCLHPIGLQIALIGVRRFWPGPEDLSFVLIYSTIALLVSAAMAWVSYRFFETPFLRLKGRSRTATPIPSAAEPILAPASVASEK
ncbi:acyltransferase family protein [Hymenobacter sp. HD11105]